MKQNPIRVVVADDHFVVRVGLVAILNLEPDLQVVGEAEDGQQALELVRREEPDITLMDVRMPLLNGIEATLAIHQVHSGSEYLPAEVARRLSARQSGDQLSPRELEVLHLLVKGLSNKEIDSLLGFSENTAKAHLKGIFSKLQVNARTEAVTEAIHRGIIHME